MDFFFVIAFLTIYYIRPHEWIEWVGILRPITLTILLSVFSLFFRERGLTFAHVLKTPHDRFMSLYLLWICFASSSFFDTLERVYHLFVFYFLVTLILYDRDRLKGFVKWWVLMIYAIAFLAWASEIGFDPTGSYNRTHGSRLQGRLILNTSLFNNPNALGHSIVPLIGIIYLYYFWKRNITYIFRGFLTSLIPLYVMYLTQSKGTYLSGFVMLTSTLTFKRGFLMKIVVIATMATAGLALLMFLPRMEDLRRGKQDREEGIEGRIAAWNFGQKCLEEGTILGYSKFATSFQQAHGFLKPSHCSYVQIGAELSYPGLFFYVGLIYLSFRSLHEIKTKTIEEERIRRILFVLLVSYCASGWTVDFAYRATFFILVGTIAALHRLHLPDRPNAEWVNPDLPEAPQSPESRLFTKLRIIDLPIMICLTYLTVRTWYALKTWI